jgi:hypothetical protein
MQYLRLSTYHHTLFCNKTALPLTGAYQYRHTSTGNFREDGSARKAHFLGLLVPQT